MVIRYMAFAYAVATLIVAVPLAVLWYVSTRWLARHPAIWARLQDIRRQAATVERKTP